MTENRFIHTKLSKVMSYESFIILDKLLQQSQKLPENSKIPTSKYFNGHNANLLTSICIKYIKLIGGHAVRINSMGVPRKAKNGKMIWTKGSSKGVADVQAIISGVPVMLEIKYSNDKISPAQLKYQKEIEKAGGTYIIVRSFNDLLSLLRNLSKEQLTESKQ